MKCSSATICILFFAASLKAQILPSSCITADTAIFNKYYRDATAMAVERLYLLKNPDTINVSVSTVYVDSIWPALLAVHNAIGLQHGDTVKDMHTCPTAISPWFYISADSSKIWINNWNNHVVLTGDTMMDNFLLKYQIDSVSPFLGFYFFWTKWGYNIRALMDSMKTIPGVFDAWNNLYCGNCFFFITFDYDGYYKYLTYTRVYSMDCAEGPFYQKHYYYRIYPDCSVEELSLSSTNDIKVMQLSIYPNPSTGIVKIQMPFGAKRGELKIYDTDGRCVSLYSFSGEERTTDLKLNRGIYFVQFIDGVKSYTNKLLIE